MKFTSSIVASATLLASAQAWGWGPPPFGPPSGPPLGAPHGFPERSPLGLNATNVCTLLSKAIPKAISYQGDAVYTTEQTGLPDAGYWSVQESSLLPACRITPSCSLDVSIAVGILVASQTKFAVRGGGHTAFAGAANIDGTGITIDLSQMNDVVISSDNKTVSVGGGARWIEVYRPLVDAGLMVCGGRVAPVGVGGLTTGGGKCFFASKTGFTCDGVSNFELVTSTGLILQVNAKTFPNLFKALKGGNNNFGVVTRFDFNTFPQGDMWGGEVINLPTSQPQQASALYNLIENTGSIMNPVDDVQVINAYVLGTSGNFYVNYFTNTAPKPWPSQLDEFHAIAPALLDTTRIGNITTFNEELATGTPNGQFYIFGTITFSNNQAFMGYLKNLTDATYSPFLANATDPALQVSMVLQPLTKAMIAPGCNKNSLGLCPSDDGNLVFLDLTVSWTLESNSAIITAASNNFIAQASAAAKKAGILNQYIYLNYALPGQDPIASYGPGNKNNMIAQSKLFDPSQAFQKLVPGGFKLQR